MKEKTQYTMGVSGNTQGRPQKKGLLKNVLYDIITIVIAVAFAFCMFLTPIAIGKGFENLTIEAKLQTGALIIIGDELRELNKSGKEAIKGAGLSTVEAEHLLEMIENVEVIK